VLGAVFSLVIGFKRTVILGLVCGAFLGIASAALAASYARSGTGYTAVIDGHEYGTFSTVYVGESGSPSDWASTDVWTTNGDNVAVGWEGADARKFKNGSICEQTGYQYNSFTTNSEEALADNTACGSGTYYSYGLIAVWNGTAYDYYYSQVSPSLNG
jgi:hypothetical protein